jgi:hypothetical protein
LVWKHTIWQAWLEGKLFEPAEKTKTSF